MLKNVMYFGGGNSRAHGAVVTTLPSIPAAQARGEWEEALGVHGSRFRSEDALESIDLPVQLYIYPDADLDSLMSWLSGDGDLRFNDWPWTWRARRTAGFNLIPCAFNDGWNATVVFKIQPHRYKYPAASPITLTGAGSVSNPCTAEAQPLITITGTGNVTLMVGSSSVLINSLTVANPVTLDCEAKVAYTGNYVSANDRVEPVNGWPVLAVGSTMINWSGGTVRQVQITPRWRSL